MKYTSFMSPHEPTNLFNPEENSYTGFADKLPLTVKIAHSEDIQKIHCVMATKKRLSEKRAKETIEYIFRCLQLHNWLQSVLPSCSINSHAHLQVLNIQQERHKLDAKEADDKIQYEQAMHHFSVVLQTSLQSLERILLRANEYKSN